MTIPVSAKFDICDWNNRSDATSDAGDRSLSDPVSSFEVFADLTEAVFVVDDTVSLVALGKDRIVADRIVQQALVRDITVPENFTLEFDLVLSEEIPLSFADPEIRVFVGAANQQGNTAGLIFSYQGIALATHPEDPRPSILGGSRELLFQEDGSPKPSVTFRYLVNGEDGRLAIYVADTSVAYNEESTGAQWAELADIDLRYNVVAPTTVLQLGDVILLHASTKTSALVGALATNTIFSVASVRLASLLRFPEEKPLATILAPRQGLVSSVINLSGSTSFDKKNAQLSFVWDLDLAPKDSSARFSGGAQATAVIGDQLDDNEIQIRYRAQSSEGDFWVTVVSVGGPGSSLELSVNLLAKELRIKLGADAGGVANTFARSVIAAFSIRAAIGFSEEAAELFAAELVNIDDLNEGVLPAGSFGLAGGGGSLLRDPVFLPDKEGLYIIRLRTYNGIRFSSPDLHTLLVQSSDQLIGHRPNSDYIFNYLSDFWKLVGDRQILSEVWSAATQVLSGELVSAWQHDFSKSIRDLSRRYQRRWLNHVLFVEVPIEVTTAVTVPTLPGTLDLAVEPAATGERLLSASIVSASESPPVDIGYVLVRADRFPAAVVDISGVKKTDPKWTLLSTRIGFPSVRVLAERTAGSWVFDPAAPVVVPQTTGLFFDVTYDDPFNPATDKLRVYSGDSRNNGDIIDVSEVNEENRLVTAEDRDVDGLNYLWDHVVVPSTFLLEQIPYLTLSVDFDLQAQDVEAGDYLQVTLVDPTTFDEVTVFLSVLATHGQVVFVEWQPLFSALQAAQELAGAIQEQVGYELLRTASVKVVGIFRHRRAAPYDDLLAVPSLGETTLTVDLYQGRDFNIIDQRVNLTSLIEGSITCTAGAVEVEWAQGELRHPDALEATLTSLQALGGFLLLVDEGDSGAFLITDVSGSKLTLDRPMRMGCQSTARITRYSASSPSPLHLWAELSYFDNAQTIENNFGLMVGLPKKDLDAVTNTRVDYLDAVRSMAFAFVMGPSFDNMQLAVQALFGLPFSERVGLIVSIVEPIDKTERGRITILSDDDIVRTYTYPFGAALATNPRTGETYQAIDPDLVLGLNPASYEDSLALFIEAKLATGVEPEAIGTAEFDLLFAQWQNAAVGSYEKLVDVVRIDDYITDPPLLEDLLPGQEILRKYHTFVVDVPLNITKTTEVFSVIRKFLQEAKPAYTNFIFFGSFNFVDQIDVEDVLVLHPTLLLRDSIHTSPIHSLDANVWPAPYNPALAHDVSKRWPVDETVARADGLAGPWLDPIDVTEKYESGYTQNFLDDFSGDGSWNRRQKQLHMINAMDNDIDVVKSWVWIPIAKDTAGGQSLLEFARNEEVELLTAGAPLASTWDESPPVIMFIGVGEHPRMPFGVFLPQNVHPNTYLVLEFENQNYTTASNFGHKDRLIEIFANIATPDLQIRGKTSGAIGDVKQVVDPDDPVLGPSYYHIEHFVRADRFTDFNPEIQVSLSEYVYIPLGGMTIDDFEAKSTYLQKASGHNVHRQTQQRPYFPATAEDLQYVPSFDPGFFTDWKLTLPADKSNTKVHWGYAEVGVQAFVNQPVDQFLLDPDTTPMENIHIGICVRERKDRHFTHGFPAKCQAIPSVVSCVLDAGVGEIRIEGFFFIEDDPSRTVIPDFATPADFDGTIGGCWIYFRHRTLGLVFPVVSFVFETGFNGALGLPLAANQPSDGHVLICPVPVGMPLGEYDIIVRHFRPYFLENGGLRQLDVVDAECPAAYIEQIGGPGAIVGLGLGLGLDSFGDEPVGIS